MARNKDLQVYGFQTGGPDFVKRAMLYYIQRYSHVTFIVCSDDIKWCRQNIALNQSDIMSLKSDSNNNIITMILESTFTSVTKTQPDYVHLAILAACNHSIICGGTFGWWSAFLAGGEAVYYKDYPRPGSQMESGFSPTKSDHYLPGWIKAYSCQKDIIIEKVKKCSECINLLLAKCDKEMYKCYNYGLHHSTTTVCCLKYLLRPH
jgi:hypothetical protein